MELIEWKDSYSVNVEELDRQHKSMFDLINRCHKLIKADKFNKEIRNVIEQLKDYADEHFALEEEYMRRTGYSDIKEHIHQHWQFIKTVMDLEEQFDIDNRLTQDDIMLFLTDWLLDHIITSDQDYSITLNDSGIV